MKFTIKVFISTIIIVAISFSTGAYLLISDNFRAAMDREIKRGLEEYQLLKFAYESAIISSEMQEQQPTEETMRELALQLTNGAGSSGRFIRVYGSQLNEIYTNLPTHQKVAFPFQSLSRGQRKYLIERMEGRYFLTVSGAIEMESGPVYLCSSTDISEVFMEKDRQIQRFVLLDALIIGVSAAAMLIISFLLTYPIKKLKETSMLIAGGDFGRRVSIHSRDEVGELAVSFNKMADAVEEKMAELERIAQQRAEFVANFTHELKTPLTSIIGYADILRSKECDQETIFTAASYIFSEGKRLEALSLKLMELMLLEKQELELQEIRAKALMEELRKSVEPLLAESNLDLDISAEDAILLAEPDLIKTLLINLIDNSRKASEPGKRIEISGNAKENSYIICVKDHGRGIPKEELPKITQAFYMVDKSRARVQHGAGLGLALASKIAALHGTELSFQSVPGQGTQVSFCLRRIQGWEVDDDAE